MKILYVNLTLVLQQITKPAKQRTNNTTVSATEYCQHSNPRYSMLQSKHYKAKVLVQSPNLQFQAVVVTVSKETERATQPEVKTRGTKMYLDEGSDTVKG